MRISAIDGLRIGILGYGREGAAAYRLVTAKGGCASISIFCDSPTEVPPACSLHTGREAHAGLAEIDLLIRSPGYAPAHPLRLEADRLGLPQTTLTNIFMREVRDAGLPVIGITGSKGKSTTSTLTHLILQQAGIASVLVGNIGNVAMDALDDIVSREAIPVMELSSFQCADLEPGYGPSSGCILDLFPEHLDWHGSTAHYFQAKFRLAQSQRPTDTLVVNTASRALMKDLDLPAQTIDVINDPLHLHFSDHFFRDGDKELISDREMKIRGLHNRRNALAAFALARIHGAEPAHFSAAIAGFCGLPYRLQEEGRFHGIHWINDAISTTPDSTIAALQCFDLDGSSVIIGGKDRGVDPRLLASYLAGSSIRAVILLPDTGRQLAALLKQQRASAIIEEAANLDQAVQAARKFTAPGAYCIFSPGAASFNAYASFEKRGEHFSRLIRA